MNTRITNDENKRREFKEQVAQKVVKSLTPKPIVASASPAPIDVKVPSNFFQIPEMELFGYIRQTLPSDQAVEVIEQLMGRTPRTDQFRIILLSPEVKVDEPKQKIVKEVPVVKIDLPADFSTYRKKEQFAYLTRERVLTTDQANDIIDIIDGKEPIGFAVYEISYSEIAKFPNPLTEAKPKPSPISIVLPHDFTKRSRAVQEYDLVKNFNISLADARDVLSVLNGKKIDREVTITVEKAPIEAAKIVEEYPLIEVDLPYNFASLRPQDQFMFLKMRKRLTEDQANDVLITFKGGTPLYNRVVIKDSIDRPQDYEEQAEEVLTAIEITLPHNFKVMKRATQEMLLTKGYELSLAEARDVISTVNLVPVKRSVSFSIEEPPAVAQVPEKEFPKLLVEVPAFFATLDDSQKYAYLINDQKLNSHQANDVISVVNGKTPLYFAVTIDEIENPSIPGLPEKIEVILNPVKVTLPHNFNSLKRASKEVVLTTLCGLSLDEAKDVLLAIEEKPTKRIVEFSYEEAPVIETVEKDFPEIIIELPEAFNSLVESQKYAYLTTNAKLTSQQAGDVLAVYNGKTPAYSKVIIKEV